MNFIKRAAATNPGQIANSGWMVGTYGQDVGPVMGNRVCNIEGKAGPPPRHGCRFVGR